MKKFFSAILLMTMMVFSVGTFVSCNDLVNEIEGVKGQTTELEAAIAELEGDIATLETALQNAKTEAANAAKAAADAAAKAQETGDNAALAAKDAAAAAANAQAKADALETAIAEAKTALENALAGKADVADVEAAVKEIEALKTALEGKADKTSVEALEAQVAILKATLTEYKTLLDNLGIEDKKLQDAYADLEARLQKTLSDMQAADDTHAEAIADLVKDLEAAVAGVNSNLVSYDKIINDLVNQIQSVAYVPENADGTMSAALYYLGDAAKPAFASDILVKATYEITPARLAKEIKDNNVAFYTVPVTKAGAREEIDAEVVEAKDGRLTVYARIDAKSDAYATLLKGENTVSLALNIFDNKEDVMLSDSSKVNASTHVTSGYNAVADFTTTELGAAIKLYDKTTKTYASKVEIDTVTVSYEDLSAHDIYSNYELRARVEGQDMTLEQIEKFLGVELDVTYDVNAVHYNAADQNLATLAQTDRNVVFPIVVEKNGFKTTAANTKKDKKYFDYYTVVTMDNFVLNNNKKLTVGAEELVATFEISYANADISFASHTDVWSFMHWAVNSNVYTLQFAEENPELAVTSSVDITKLSFMDEKPFTKGETITIPMVAKYTKADGKPGYENGTVTVKCLSSKAVELTQVTLPFRNETLTYEIDHEYDDPVQFVDADKVAYSLDFTITLGGYPTDKIIPLGTIELDGLTNSTMTKSVNAIEKVLKTDAKYYADLLTEENIGYLYDGTVGFTEVYPTDPDAVVNPFLSNLAFSSKVENNKTVWFETSQINADVADTYSKDLELQHTFEFCGVKYTFTADVKVVEPEYTINPDALLVKNGVAPIHGEVGFPNYANNKASLASDFVLQAIYLNDYVILNDDAKKAVNAGELQVVYELKTTVKEAGKDVSALPDGAFTEVITKTTDVNKLNWSNKEVSKLDFVISLESVKTKKVDDKDVPVKVFGTVPVTLEVKDYVKLQAKKTVPSVDFQTGAGAENVINFVQAIEVVGTDKALYPTTAPGKNGYLYNAGAENFDEIWTSNKYTPSTKKYETLASTDALYDETFFQVYGQEITYDYKKAEATYAGQKLDKSKYEVDPIDGTVTLLVHDSPILEDVIVTVPVTLTHWYGEAETVTATVKFNAVK